MSMSLKSKLFYKFVRSRMKKYVNNEQEYITKRCPGQTFGIGGSRESKYKPSKGYKILRGKVTGLNYELLTLSNDDLRPISKRKVIYMLHGGAYHMSLTDLYNGVMEKYSNGTYEVFAIDYRTAPKNLYPAALGDAVRGFNILTTMGYSAENIIMAGDSAGAGLALAMALKLRDENKDFPKSFVLSSPWVDLSKVYTEEQKANDVLFGWGNVLELCANKYADNNDLKSPYISPVFDNFEGFSDAKVYISVANGEMLESQGEELARKLRKANATVVFDKLDSGMHAIITMYMLGTKECKDAWERIHRFIYSLAI